MLCSGWCTPRVARIQVLIDGIQILHVRPPQNIIVCCIQYGEVLQSTDRSNRGVDYMSRGQDGNARYLSRYHHIQIGWYPHAPCHPGQSIHRHESHHNMREHIRICVYWWTGNCTTQGIYYPLLLPTVQPLKNWISMATHWNQKSVESDDKDLTADTNFYLSLLDPDVVRMPVKNHDWNFWHYFFSQRNCRPADR